MDRFQVMPELSFGEYEKLKQSISEQGVLIPVEKDADTGEILDGFHRLRACEELGIEPPVIERRFENDREREIHALTLNLARRQIGPVEWGKTFEKLVEIRRAQYTGRGDRAPGLRSVAKEAGIPESTARDRRKLARDLEDYPDLADKVDRGEITPMEGRRRAEVASPKEEKPPKEPAVGDLVGEDFEPPPRELTPEQNNFYATPKHAAKLRKLDPEKEAEEWLEVKDDGVRIEPAIRAAADAEGYYGRLRERLEALEKEQRREAGNLRVVGGENG